jgi:hypothetical protein
VKRALLLGGIALVLCSSLALGAPESLLPPGFDTPTPTPAPRRTAAPQPAPTVVPPQPTATPGPDQQPLPAPNAPLAPIALPSDFPSVEQIESMTPDEMDDLFGLKPKFDLPAAARRATRRIGVISKGEGGFPSQSLAGQPESLVRAALAGTKHELVSRWGHILLRRTLASRLDAPEGMDPVEFAALRAKVLNTLGESYAARALVQDVDSSNYNSDLTDAAFDAYLATGDIVGICPVARLKSDIRSDPNWQLARSICLAFAGSGRESNDELDKQLSREIAPKIDVLLAQRYAGAAWEGARAVTIEWNGVGQLTPWRYSIATALGLDVPSSLRNRAGPWYDMVDAVSPAQPLATRAAAADLAARRGVFSSAAMVDLYGQVFADQDDLGDISQRASQLREAYVADTPAERIAAMRDLWGGADTQYARMVLTAYAAARIQPDKSLKDDAADLIASMLTAGLDRNAIRWAPVVDRGSQAWALLALAQPEMNGAVNAGALDDYVGSDKSAGQRKAKFLVAGLAGLGRLDRGTIDTYVGRLGLDLGRQSPWSERITKAAQVGNPALVALLAGLGMQGSSWNKMTGRELYFIVRSLDQVGLSAEARMIAAEAVTRG